MMFSYLIILSISFLPSLIDSSVSFIRNPNCNIPECSQFNQRALYYGTQVVGNNKIHIVYSSFDELTVMIMQTTVNDAPVFNYNALLAKNYSAAFQFDDTKPINSFTIILRRLIEFNDADNSGTMKDNDNTTIPYYLNNATITNLTSDNNNTVQPSFEYQLPTLNGTLKVDIVYPGVRMRDSKFPKLGIQPSSFFLNIVLQANNYSFANSRFTYELYTLSQDASYPSLISTKYIDDQYTPGIFNVWQLKPSDKSQYPSSMLWKPVVYLSEERTIEENTLMQIYTLKTNVTLNSNIDQGIYYAMFRQPYVSAFNVSLGATDDGYFAKNNYGFVQFTAGLDVLQPDATAKFVTVALIISLALPAIVGIIALIFVLKRRLSKEKSTSYDAIDS